MVGQQECCTQVSRRRFMSSDFEGKTPHSDETSPGATASPVDRRHFLIGAAAGAATMALPRWAHADMLGSNPDSILAAFQDDLAPIRAEITKRHDETVQRMQTWMKQPSIAAENRGMNEGGELTMQMLRDAGFQQVTKAPTDGQPGIFATLDAGAPKTLGLYFMYDVKQVDPSEWSSPPWEARIVDKPGFGKVVVGRGAVNQKGPEATFLAALHAIRGAGRKPEVLAALKKTVGIFMPFASQDPDGKVTAFLGAKGVVELELVSSGEKWGR